MFQLGQIGFVDGIEEAEIRSWVPDGSRVTVLEINTGVWWYGLDAKRFLPKPLKTYVDRYIGLINQKEE